MDENKRIKAHIRKLVYGPVLILPVIAVFLIVALVIDEGAAKFLVILLGVALVFCIAWVLLMRRKSYGALIEYSEAISGDVVLQAENLPFPFVITDQDEKILWCNRAFLAMTGHDSGSLTELLPELAAQQGESASTTRVFAHEGRMYQLGTSTFSADDTLRARYFIDDTDRIMAVQKAQEKMPVRAEIYVDNYDEVMASVETVRQSLLAAIIERKLNKYFGQYGGILNKLEKDKYVAVLNNKALQDIEKNHFSILEEIKSVSVGNAISPTLSIGVGLNGESLNEDAALCRMAMDLCLGRGGDQAIIRTAEDTRYYGGKSHGQEKNTRVKARIKAQALKELFMTKDQILVMGHSLPDIDALGAAAGIYRVARGMAKKVHIVLEEETSSIRPMAQRFRNNTEYPEDLFIKGSRALELLDENTAVVVVDVNKPSYTECPELIQRSNCIVVLDHHRQGEEAIAKATLSYIEPYASSASEMVAEILQYMMVNVKLTVEEADAMYAGIVVDTNNFMNKTGVRTFEAAAYLRRNGADTARVRKMFREPMGDYQAKAETVRGVELVGDHYAFGVCNAEGLESPTIIAAQAANDLLNIIGVKASMVFTKFQDKVYISARSIDEVNVQLIMERLGGGGHLSIAGAQLKGCSVEEAMALVKETIQQMEEEGAI